MFKFDPIPEEEMNTSTWQNIREGIAFFKISEVSCDEDSGSMKITYNIKDNKGNSGRWYDNFSVNTQWKVIQLLKAVGRAEWYKSGKIDPSRLVGLDGQCEMKSREYNGKSSIQIGRYIEKDMAETVNSSVNSNWDDDTIPF